MFHYVYQIVANFVCLLCAAEQGMYSKFSRGYFAENNSDESHEHEPKRLSFRPLRQTVQLPEKNTGIVSFCKQKTCYICTFHICLTNVSKVT